MGAADPITVRWVPTRRTMVFGMVVLSLAVVAGTVASVRPWLLALDTFLVALVGIDVWSGRRREASVERSTEAVFSVGRDNGVTLEIHNGGGRVLEGMVADDPVDDMEVHGLPAPFRVGPGQSVSIGYHVVPHSRGPRSFGAVGIRYRSLLGLVDRQERHPLPTRVDVYPDLHRGRTLNVFRRQGRWDPRLGSSLSRGGTREFERLRPYQTGDDPRHIDRRATARRDEPIVRQFQVEAQQNILLAVDLGRTMRGATQGLSYVDHALNGALLAANVALDTGDKVGFVGFDGEPRIVVAPMAGPSAAHRLTRATHALQASLQASDPVGLARMLVAQFRARSLFIVFSNVLDQQGVDDWALATEVMARRHLALLVLLRDPTIDGFLVGEGARGTDPYVRAAAAEWVLEREAMVNRLRRRGALVLDGPAHRMTPPVVQKYLEIKGRGLL